MLCAFFTGNAIAQPDALKSIYEDFDAHRKQALQEKMFLHLDRPVYISGETMWFKIYTVDGALHQPLDLSKVAYVEILDADQSQVLQTKVALNKSTGNGSFILPATLNSGNYTVRAYTNWMRNYGPEFYFSQLVTIVNTFKTSNDRTIPETSGYTIDFFPEGGNILAGVPNTIAFKAISILTGEGIDFTAELRDEQGKKISDFKPHKFGIGHVTFTPLKNQKYTAFVKPAGHKSFTKQLPAALERGYTLQLQNFNADKLQLTVKQAGLGDEQLYLLGHSRQIVTFTEKAAINQGTATFILDKKQLADGITHFTVFNSQKQPVSERLYFKHPGQALRLNVAGVKETYSSREKVILDLSAQAGNSNPTANLSLAVYRLDSLQKNSISTIESYIWLTSDLKGIIEQPEYYFSGTGATDAQAIDNLMLTHGWSRFNWKDVIEKKGPVHTYLPEHNGHWISGKVTNRLTGEPAPDIITYLSSPGTKPGLYDSKSDLNGNIRFEVKDFFNTRDIIVQSDFTKDSIYNFEIRNAFSTAYPSVQLPALRLTESLEYELTLRHIQMQAQHAYFGTYINTFKPGRSDSIAFYGTPSEQYLLDDYKRFKVMEEVIREYVPGVQLRKRGGHFNFMVFNRPYKSIFQNNPMVLLDGVPIFDIDKIMAFDPLKVKKLEVVTSRFFDGPLASEGLVSFKTYKGDLGGFEPDTRALIQSYDGLQQQREFYSPTYATDVQKASRKADLRNLLYWAPDLNVKSGGLQQVSFYTSDQEGTYMVVLQGITGNGNVGSETFTFHVTKPVL